MINYKAADLSINHDNNFITSSALDAADHWLLFASKTELSAIISALPYGEIINQRLNAANDLGNYFRTFLPNQRGTELIIYFSNAHDSFQNLTDLRLALSNLLDIKKNKVLAISFAANLSAEFNSATLCADVVVITAAAFTPLPNFKNREVNSIGKVELNFYGSTADLSLTKRAIIEAEANGLVRYLALLPANILYPLSYRNFVQALAKKYSWKIEFYDIASLHELKAGAFLAVCQGSSRHDAGILHIRYQPNLPSKQTLALVGKGLCFDTGGYNLKTQGSHMLGMKMDMTGSAIALATLMAFSELEVDFNIDCYLALAQNDIGPDAYKPSDVVVAANGMSIEVINTDAEGRMVLADTLYLASRNNPNLILDYATLTGSCIRALDQLYSGAITNRPVWNSKLIEIGQACGERVWPFPYTAEYDEKLKSEIADIKQCYEGPADQIRAARFLGKFIQDEAPWIHIDLSAAENKGGLAQINSEVTGFGVRFTLAAILDFNLLNEAK